MLFNIFDRMTIRVLRVGDRWQAFHVSNDGKKRSVQDLHIPASTTASEIISVLDDGYHELSTGPDSNIIRLDDDQ